MTGGGFLLPRVMNARLRASRAVRELLLILRDRAGLPLPGMNRAGGSAVLMYHGVVASAPSLLNWRHVSEKDFDCHLRLLRRYCNVVPLATLFTGDIATDRLNVAITFDDGFRNNLQVAVPLLRKHRVPASFFVTAANHAGMNVLWPDFLDIVGRYASDDVVIDGRSFTKRGTRYYCRDSSVSLATVIRNERPDWAFKQAMYRAFSRWASNLQRPDLRQYWELMTDDEIAETAAVPGMTIGSHGFYHNNLGSLSTTAALDELVKSKAYLENLIQREIQELAYPDGSYTPGLVQAARVAGFSRQLAVDHRYGEPPFSLSPLRRHGVYSMAPARAQLVEALAT